MCFVYVMFLFTVLQCCALYILNVVYVTAFAFGSSYVSLFVTRVFQGASSAVTAVTGNTYY